MFRHSSLLFALLVFAGCSRPFPADHVPRMKILIPDFEMAEGLREDTRDVRGWWFGANTIYQNPRAGAMFAERLNAKMTPLPFLNMFSVSDLKYYFAGKRELLKKAFPHLEDSEINDMMRQVPVSDFARELGADKVISGRIVSNYLGENRTIHWWSSFAQIEVRVTDAVTGRVEWEKEYQQKRWFASQFTVQDEIAGRVEKDLKEEYFRPLALASAP